MEENINFSNVGPIGDKDYKYRSKMAIRNFLKNTNKNHSKEELVRLISIESKGLFNPALVAEEVDNFKNK